MNTSSDCFGRLSLDAVGNSTNTGGTSRTVNSKNPITAISGLTTPTYDDNGNVTTDQAGNQYYYDAWNRLVFVNLPGLSTNENYTYSAGGARPGISVCNGATTTSYYSAQWQDLEDDIVVTGECGSTTTKSTYLWSEAYIDELVARDTSANGGSVTRTYAQQDANHDVTSLTNSSGTVLERFIYDPYGKQTVLNASWSSTSDSYNWVYGFQGGRLDALTGLVNFRNRDLNPVTGTWMEQDPAGYVNGADLYQFEEDDPADGQDPLGLYKRGLTAQESRERIHQMLEARKQQQIKDITAALTNLAKNCACQKGNTGDLAKDLATAIADTIASHNEQLLFSGGWQAGGWSDDLDPNKNVWDCGAWARNIAAAAATQKDFRDAYKAGNSSFRVDEIRGHGFGHALFPSYPGDGIVNHSFVIISCTNAPMGKPGSYVVIDPWPTGGVNVLDDSSAMSYMGGDYEFDWNRVGGSYPAPPDPPSKYEGGGLP